MKYFFYIPTCLLLLWGCEDVVDIGLQEEEPRLIINAILRVNEENPTENRVRITQSAGFFDEIDIPIASALIPPDGFVQRGAIGYAPDPNDPHYWVPGSDGVPFGENQLLVGEFDPEARDLFYIIYEDEVYLAEYFYTPAPPIDSVIVGDGQLLEDDETEIILTFTDPIEESNYYIVGYGDGDYIALEDRFFNGENYTFSYVKNRVLDSGDQVTVTLWGVDEKLYTYFLELIEQSDMSDNALFSTPVTTVRGNFLKVEGINNIDVFNNVGRPQEFILGYFAVVQEHARTLTID